MNRLPVVQTGFRALAALCFVVIPAATLPATAQINGPVKPPTAPIAPRATQSNQPGKPEPPPIPPEQIIQRFAAKEDEMLRASLAYGFDKRVRIEEMGADNKPTGEVEILTQQVVAADGTHYEKVLRRTESTLQYLQAERGDLSVIDSAPLFPFTTSQIPKYEITYEGTQPLDELNVYIFAVKPRALDRAHAYFSGVVWVDQEDLVIVKTIGKWITETGDVTSPTLPFTVFETYRQQVDKNNWFPAYSRSDDFLEQGKVRTPIRMIIEWSNYTLGAGPSPAASPSSASNPSPAGTPAAAKP